MPAETKFSKALDKVQSPVSYQSCGLHIAGRLGRDLCELYAVQHTG